MAELIVDRAAVLEDKSNKRYIAVRPVFNKYSPKRVMIGRTYKMDRDSIIRDRSVKRILLE